MLHAQAAILNNGQPRFCRPLCRFGVLDPELHPYHLRPDLDGLFDQWGDVLRPPEDIHDLNGIRN
jgi:hypothetical protein